MAAAIHLKEYASAPSVLANGAQLFTVNPICEQDVACGPSPSASAAFSQQTHYIQITLGTDQLPYALPGSKKVFYSLGLTGVISLTNQIPVADYSTLIVAVGPGSRIAFVSFGV